MRSRAGLGVGVAATLTLTLDKRRQPRITFSRSAHIEVEQPPVGAADSAHAEAALPSEAGTTKPTAPSAMLARIQNLSRTGMALTAPRLPEKGANVKCRIRLGDAAHALRGRVAWTKASPPSAGIEFIDLTAQDDAILANVTQPHLDKDSSMEPVSVWWDGRKEPLRTKGRVEDDGAFEIVHELPQLKIGSEARVVTMSKDGVPVPNKAFVHELILEPGTARETPRVVVKLRDAKPSIDNSVETRPRTVATSAAEAPTKAGGSQELANAPAASVSAAPEAAAGHATAAPVAAPLSESAAPSPTGPESTASESTAFESAHAPSAEASFVKEPGAGQANPWASDGPEARVIGLGGNETHADQQTGDGVPEAVSAPSTSEEPESAPATESLSDSHPGRPVPARAQTQSPEEAPAEPEEALQTGDLVEVPSSPRPGAAAAASADEAQALSAPGQMANPEPLSAITGAGKTLTGSATAAARSAPTRLPGLVHADTASRVPSPASNAPTAEALGSHATAEAPVVPQGEQERPETKENWPTQPPVREVGPAVPSIEVSERLLQHSPAPLVDRPAGTADALRAEASRLRDESPATPLPQVSPAEVYPISQPGVEPVSGPASLPSALPTALPTWVDATQGEAPPENARRGAVDRLAMWRIPLIALVLLGGAVVGWMAWPEPAATPLGPEAAASDTASATPGVTSGGEASASLTGEPARVDVAASSAPAPVAMKAKSGRGKAADATGDRPGAKASAAKPAEPAASVSAPAAAASEAPSASAQAAEPRRRVFPAFRLIDHGAYVRLEVPVSGDSRVEDVLRLAPNPGLVAVLPDAEPRNGRGPARVGHPLVDRVSVEARTLGTYVRVLFGPEAGAHRIREGRGFVSIIIDRR